MQQWSYQWRPGNLRNGFNLTSIQKHTKAGNILTYFHSYACYWTRQGEGLPERSQSGLFNTRSFPWQLKNSSHSLHHLCLKEGSKVPFQCVVQALTEHHLAAAAVLSSKYTDLASLYDAEYALGICMNMHIFQITPKVASFSRGQCWEDLKNK